MIDKIQKVSNPLTIIAIFAGLAEVAATVALGLIESDVQKIFIWFVMLFPIILVCLFFFVLWKKHHVLYGPSDFQKEEHFMAWAAQASQVSSQVNNAIEKIEESNENEINIEKKQEVTKELKQIKDTVGISLAPYAGFLIELALRNAHRGLTLEEIAVATKLEYYIVSLSMFGLQMGNKVILTKDGDEYFYHYNYEIEDKKKNSYYKFAR